ncbi:PREDICTED: PRKC apoptosis WT1 regulator protein [Merops nubicus]|uniref:PRKC apoptosis WT1 regulator protein n=1 Tax=Merops nubicus TaxID=57421 RepID=UPI0004EFFED9|nr:PREDICTED: PRKC apoptosis WT1 regulator protein [Merops nubicus]
MAPWQQPGWLCRRCCRARGARSLRAGTLELLCRSQARPAMSQDSQVARDPGSTANAPEDDAPNRYSRTDRTTYSRYSRDANSSGSSIPSNALEKRIEELERELAKERQENARLTKMTQDKEELIGKLKEEIDLLNRDLDDIEDENEQLKQENKTLLKVVGQLTR